jgi:hypothetical protein
MCDMALGTATSFFPGSSVSATATLIPITDANVERGWPVLVCLDDSIANNASGNWLVYGYGVVAAATDAAGTTDVDPGIPIGVVTANSAVTAEGAAANTRALGIWGAAPPTVTGTPIAAFWTGGLPCGGVTI